MKTTLAEYIFMERNDIFQHQESIEKISKIFKEIKTLHQQIDIETNDHIGVLSEESQSTSPLGKSSQLAPSSPVKLSASSRSEADKKQTAILDKTSNEDGYFGVFSSQPQILPSYKAKNDNYRQELLNQIEEKRKRRQLELEQEKAADEELDRKIIQQRLSMYLDYLEERKRGDFIVKCKQIEHSKDSPNGDHEPKTKPFNLNGATEGDAVAKNSEPQVGGQTGPIVCSGGEAASATNRDINILSNLSEVRKIMQHDHLEMLQQLLELHIK